MQTQDIPANNPIHHTRKVKGKLSELINHLREDVSKVNDAKAEALFETTTEVLRGLETAFTHYEERSEQAWK